MSSRRTVLVLLSALSLLACGDDERGPATPDAGVDVDAAPPAITVESFCADLSVSICAGLSSCGCRFDLRAYDAAGCVAARTAACAESLGAVATPDLAAGRVKLHAASIEACLTAIDALAAACDLEGNDILPPECATYVVDTSQLGEACRLQGQGPIHCADATGVCVPGAGADTCTALPVAGQPCVAGECASGAFCAGLEAPGTCTAPGGVGAVCSESSHCAGELVCDTGGLCAARLADGAACFADDQCLAGHSCAQGTCAPGSPLGALCAGAICGSGHACGRAPETRTCGDPDLAGQLCMTDTCADGLECGQADMMCTALPGDGQPCLDGFACAAGLTCADGLGTCTPLPGQGETCAMGARFCQDGLGCDQTTNQCQPGPAAGEPCLLNPPDYVCAAGLGCDFGMTGSFCVARGGAGADCTNDTVCTADTYCEFSVLKCTARLADGASCNDGNECLAGSECAPSPAGYHCAPLPVRDQPCAFDCAGALACKGPGGQCVPEFCVIP